MELLSQTWRYPLEIAREGARHGATLVLAATSWDTLYAARGAFLHPDEDAHLARAGVRKRQADYLRGRYASKAALAHFAAESEKGRGDSASARFDPRAWHVAMGVFSQPVVRGGPAGNARVSIAHSGTWAAALAFDEAHPMAVDLELHDVEHDEVIRRESTPEEIAALAGAGYAGTEGFTILWAAKEALSKVLQTGLMAPLSFYELGEVERTPTGVICAYRHFAQYKSYCAVVGKLAVSIALPRKSVLQFDWQSLTSVGVASGPLSTIPLNERRGVSGA